MKKVKIFNIILNVITIIVYLATLLLTSFILIRYSIEDKTEGSGIYIALFFIFNTIECFVLILLNVIGIGVITLNKDKVIYDDNLKLQYKKQLQWRVIMIVVPILTFIIQILINNIIN